MASGGFTARLPRRGCRYTVTRTRLPAPGSGDPGLRAPARSSLPTACPPASAAKPVAPVRLPLPAPMPAPVPVPQSRSPDARALSLNSAALRSRHTAALHRPASLHRSATFVPTPPSPLPPSATNPPPTPLPPLCHRPDLPPVSLWCSPGASPRPPCPRNRAFLQCKGFPPPPLALNG
jgi:hypothetical protein